MLPVKQHDSITGISRADWDTLTGSEQPFLRHDYLAALETSGSIGPETGWIPRILTIGNDDGTLAGAMPLFEKHHSNGEFVFDWDWAEAYAATGRNYYPKLVAAIPFTPVSGPRMLGTSEPGTRVAQALIDYARELAETDRLSSLHWLFVDDDQVPLLEDAGCLIRTGCHFEWSNPGVGDFQEWLGTLSSSRRKSIRRERRRVAEAGIHCTWYQGNELDARQLQTVYELYAANYYAHGMRPYLTPRFFEGIARTLAESFSVCLASRGTEVVAGALFLNGQNSLYGRYWGAFEWIDCLHFEVCYYQGIERAIRKGYDRFHPGVQGEHKLLRGFEPRLHYSAHWLRDEDFRRAVAKFLERERHAIDTYAEIAATYLPFRKHEP